ncbi:MAG: Rho-binding antiterminator [Woeseiaceae bacterium]
MASDEGRKIIACVFKIEVILQLTDGSEIAGVPLTTITTADKVELLRIRSAREEVDVEMQRLAVMTAVKDNPHFGRVEF